MKTFITRWALASAGFLALELATRPRRPVDRVTVWPGGLITPLGAELLPFPVAPSVRPVVWPEPSPELVEERRALCLSECCRPA